LSKKRDTLWCQANDENSFCDSGEFIAHKTNDGAGPNVVSPITFANDMYWVSYMISLLQCLMLSKSIYTGLIDVDDRFKAIGYLLGYGTDEFRSEIKLDRSSIFYQPRREMQFDLLKQFDVLFATVDSISYSLIFSQFIVPILIVYLYFTTGGINLWTTQAIQAQFFILIIEFKAIQEAMIAIKHIKFQYWIQCTSLFSSYWWTNT